MNFFVTGTDTDVGKTIVSAVLIHYFRQQNPLYYKPIQTGVILRNGQRLSEDIETVNRLTGLGYKLKDSNTYLLEAPMSPFQAAQKENIQISMEKIKEQYETMTSVYDTVIVEGAGGVLVPLTEQHYTIDLIRALNISVIVVVRAGLGTINHSLLTLRALRDRNIPVAGFMVNRYPEHPDRVEQENPAIIETFSGIPCIGKILDSPAPLDHYQLDLPGS